ncbi:hypothetical protein PFWH6_1201 [Pseudomonas fluorescens WH6]|nr:hypothetical protein PFWH6_1201 [Pseudomonas fluorescens WH6]
MSCHASWLSNAGNVPVSDLFRVSVGIPKSPVAQAFQ